MRQYHNINKTSIYPDLQDVIVTIENQVAIIGMLPTGDLQYRRQIAESGAAKKYFPKHKEVGDALWRLRDDNSVRVIVVTGLGEMFFIPPSTSPGIAAHDPGEDWDLTNGLSKTLLGFMECNKPVIGRVNGDAIAYGSSMLFACDFVVVVEDATVGDHHLGMGELAVGRSDVGVVPGDGGVVFVPGSLPPAIANEYLMLAKPFTGQELAERGVVNVATTRDKLDVEVEDLANRLLKRSSHALAYTKRVMSRRKVVDFAQWFDGAWAYEMANFYMNRVDTTRGGEHL